MEPVKFKPINQGGEWERVCDCGTEQYVHTYECPMCHYVHTGMGHNYCPNCGRALKWD